MNHQEGDSTWSLGVLIGLPLFIIAIVGTIWLGRWVRSYGKREDDEMAWWAGFVLYVVAGGLVLGALIGYYPYKAEYHQYVTKVGTVERISSRLLGSSDSFQQKFVAEYTDGRKFGCEDTRCSLVRAGDTLVMACKRAWQYAGEDGYDCKFIASERPQ